MNKLTSLFASVALAAGLSGCTDSPYYKGTEVNVSEKTVTIHDNGFWKGLHVKANFNDSTIVFTRHGRMDGFDISGKSSKTMNMSFDTCQQDPNCAEYLIQAEKELNSRVTVKTALPKSPV